MVEKQLMLLNVTGMLLLFIVIVTAIEVFSFHLLAVITHPTNKAC